MWRTMLPSKVELFNLAQNPSESIDLSAENPQKVAELKARAEALAREAVAPLLLNEAKGVVGKVETGSVSLPEDYRALDRGAVIDCLRELVVWASMPRRSRVTSSESVQLLAKRRARDS
jgi:hypothetical protein